MRTEERRTYANGEQIALPYEPEGDVIVEATWPGGGMAYAWERHKSSQRWCKLTAAHNPAAETDSWMGLVAVAMKHGWELKVYERGPLPEGARW